MDLMKTLLIYMTATLTLAVQNTAAPQVTPTPSPVPPSVVETVGTPAPWEEVTAAPTAKPTQAGNKYTPAPVPEITPNQKAYHNITMGIAAELARIPNDKVRAIATERIEKIRHGERDFRF